MAERSSRALVERLQAANPRNHNLMWQLGVDVSQHLDLPPFHTTGADNPVISIDAAVALIKLFLGKQQPHLFLSINGLMNPPCELWRAEISWPTEAHRARGKSPALALCMALLRALDVGEGHRSTEAPRSRKAETFRDEGNNPASLGDDR